MRPEPGRMPAREAVRCRRPVAGEDWPGACPSRDSGPAGSLRSRRRDPESRGVREVPRTPRGLLGLPRLQAALAGRAVVRARSRRERPKGRRGHRRMDPAVDLEAIDRAHLHGTQDWWVCASRSSSDTPTHPYSSGGSRGFVDPSWCAFTLVDLQAIPWTEGVRPSERTRLCSPSVLEHTPFFRIVRASKRCTQALGRARTA